jgi:hypothetical protein
LEEGEWMFLVNVVKGVTLVKRYPGMDQEEVMMEIKRLKQKADRLLAMSIRLNQPNLADEAERLYQQIDRLALLTG